ncbi:hypothetical protein AB0J57_34250 [Streptomyces sp. NPDC049837]|uniref:hypothetical protein n=1 Tax=Streptomyces sp. NPDC049837 TaxID=3155277 RepID=UPI00342013EA
MMVGLLCALLAAILTGFATVLQALGARRAAGRTAASVVSALRQWPFVCGVGMDILGFGAELIALRRLPLFVVEATLASALAVTAVGASRMLKVRLRGVEWVAVAAVCAGLALLALTGGREGTGRGDEPLRVAALLAAVGLAVLGWAARSAPGGARGAVLGFIAGLDFGLVGLSVRILPEGAVGELLTEPSAYAVVIAGVTGFAFLIRAMQCGSVTAATSAMVLGETLLPAAAGVLLLGDRTRPGFMPFAFAGFALSVFGAVALARFGDVEEQQDERRPA